MTVSSAAGPTSYGFSSILPGASGSLSFTTNTVGDILVLALMLEQGGTGFTLPTISGGGVDAWACAAGSQFQSGVNYSATIYYGTVTATGAQTISVTNNNATQTLYIYEGCAQEFKTSLTGGYWALQNGTGNTTLPTSAASGTYFNTGNVNMGSSGLPLHASSVDQFWVGAGNFPNSASCGGSTAGFTYTNIVGGGAGQFVTQLNVNSTGMSATPTWTQSASSLYLTASMVFEYWIPTLTTTTTGGDNFNIYAFEGLTSKGLGFMQGLISGPGTKLWASAAGASGPVGAYEYAMALIPTTLASVSMVHQPNSEYSLLIAQGSDSNVWGGLSSGVVGKFSGTTGILSNTYTSAGLTKGALASDNRLWMATEAATVVAIDSAGVNTSYAITGTSWSTCIGGDGNIWISTATTIIKMNTSGTVLNTYTPTHMASGAVLTLGHDGNIWFAVPNFGLYNITTSGTVTSQDTTHTALSGLSWLGADNNIWYSPSTASSTTLYNCTTGGSVTLFTFTGLDTSLTTSGCAGPDGNTWFAIGGKATNNYNMVGNLIGTYTVTPTTNGNFFAFMGM